MRGDRLESARQIDVFFVTHQALPGSFPWVHLFHQCTLLTKLRLKRFSGVSVARVYAGVASKRREPQRPVGSRPPARDPRRGPARDRTIASPSIAILRTRSNSARLGTMNASGDTPAHLLETASNTDAWQVYEISDAADAPTIPHIGISRMLAARLTLRPTIPATAVAMGRPRPDTYEARIFERLSDMMPGMITTRAGKAACHSGFMKTKKRTKPAGTMATAAMKVVSIASRETTGAIRSASARLEAEIAG